MKAFVYPKGRHQRMLAPGPYANYRSFKPYLQDEFSRTCVYCRQPDGIRGYAAFGVDHYRPKERFPTVAVEYSNLYYTCNTCNSNKSDFWPSQAESKAGRFIPNPCDHAMWEHLRFRKSVVEARTTAGKAAEEILRLNDPEMIKWRGTILATTALFLEKKANIQRTLGDIRRRLSSAPSGVKTTALERGLQDAENNLSEVTSHLALFGG